MANVSIFPINVELERHPLEVYSVSSETPPIYSSTFWVSNPGKPSLNISVSTPADSYHRLTMMQNDHAWSDVIVATFLVETIKENPNIFSYQTTEAWNADGRVIAAANTLVSPLSVLSITATPYPEEDTPIQVTTSAPDKRLSKLYALLMIYRKTLSKSTNANYRTELARRLNNFFQTNILKTTNEDITSVSGYIGEDRLTESYKKIICAIDMFFFKFSHLSFSCIRMATLPVRYRGCVALTALGQIARAVGLSPQELTMFIFTNPVAKDLINITKAGEGVGDKYGYFPYHLELGLTTKSAYSMSVNPSLCLWLHTIGAIMGYLRSYNARMPDAMDLGGTFETAAAVALSIGGGVNMQKQFESTADKAQNVRTKITRLQALREETESDSDTETQTDEDPGIQMNPN